MSLLSSDDEHASSQNASHEAGQPVDDVYDDSEYNAYQQTAAAEPMVGAGRAKEDDAEIDHSEASTPNDDARHHRNSDDGHAEDTPTQETMSLQLQWWAFQRWHCHAKSLQEEEKSNDAVALADHGDADAHEEYAAIAGEQEGEPAPTRKRKQRAGGVGNWRRRAGDVRPSASKSVEEDTVIDAEQAARTAAREGPHRRCATQFLLAFGLKPGSRAKVAMAVRLVRARRAATASEALYARATVATEARGLADEPANSHATAGGAPEQPQLPPRFDGARAGRINGSLEQCRLCSGAIPPPRRTFCCDECVHFHLLRTSGSHVRKSLALRDGRICSECGVDAGAAYEAAKKAVREARVQGAPSAEAALALASRAAPLRARHAFNLRAETGPLGRPWRPRSRRWRLSWGDAAPRARGFVLAGRPSRGSARGRWVLFAREYAHTVLGMPRKGHGGAGCPARAGSAQGQGGGVNSRAGWTWDARSWVARRNGRRRRPVTWRVRPHPRTRVCRSCGTVGARAVDGPVGHGAIKRRERGPPAVWLGPSSSSNSSCAAAAAAMAPATKVTARAATWETKLRTTRMHTHSVSEVRHRVHHKSTTTWLELANAQAQQ